MIRGGAALLLLLAAVAAPAQPADAVPPLPTAAQVQWQQMETNAFVHFGMNTFTNREWGYGDAAPEAFCPTTIDVDQWMETFRAAGMKGVILTCKHHDGFCLWPSRHTDYHIGRSPYRGGRGDLVREVSDACRRHGLRFGIYLSPWDRHQASYGTPAYVDYYYRQLEELLTQYGDIFEVWLDGANGGDGYYGGACEDRHIDRRTYYHFERARELVACLQPQALIFSDGGPGCRWAGNERGVGATTCWSFLRGAEVYPGYDHAEELPQGHADGDQWSAPECDVSIRPGWFYHESEDTLVKSPQELAELYYQSVGRNALLLLNFPVTPAGRIHPADSAAAVGFRHIIDRHFGRDVLAGATLSSPDAFTLEARLPAPDTINCVVLQEDISRGQRVAAFVLEHERNGQWQPLPIAEETTTIGHKRILRFPSTRVARLRLRVTQSRSTPCLLRPSAYLAK